jgi:hypothetical protein
VNGIRGLVSEEGAHWESEREKTHRIGHSDS